MCKKILWTMIFVFSLILMPITAVNAMCGEGLKNMVQSFNLSTEQKDKIKPILEELKSSLKSAGSQMDDLSNQIHQQVTSTNMNQDTVNDLIDKKAKLIGDMMKAKLNAQNQILAILTPEQKTKMQDKLKRVSEKMSDHFKKCHADGSDD